ncbi:MAG TPA: D-aminoacylase [Gemmatimonadales bacterium]|jgi:N-acyl-D-amino-acid deacylase|nr:D-aminoacylase [Gemmatimonadales bacterium]
MTPLALLSILAIATPAETTLVVNAVVVDGTGAPGRRASVRIAGGRILAVGALKPARGDRVVDARGFVLAPGFIDTHAHYDDSLLVRLDALPAVSQGITTIVVGQDGEQPYPLADFFGRLQASPAAVNVASYAGHGTIRRDVLGDDFRRAASAAEVATMRQRLERELAAGALGLSTGLEYDPGIYSDPDEVLALVKVTAAAGGRYISHVRSEDRRFYSAITELLDVGKQARLPVQLSHAKLAMRSLWGSAPKLLERLDSARKTGVDVTLDVYPYTYWQSTITVLFPGRNFSDSGEAELVLAEVAAADGIRITDAADRSIVGRSIAEIARDAGEAPVLTLMRLAQRGDSIERAGDDYIGIIGTSMAEEDIATLLAWPHANVSSDGASGGGHPRGWGAFPRVLGRYVRERKVVSLEDAVRKMTSLSAAHVGLKDRGTIAPGSRADLVLFNPKTVADRATPASPSLPAAGILRVWTNGVEVYRDGKPTGARPGVVLRRGGSGA